MSTEPLLTLDELAAALNISVRTIKRWTYAGEIPVAIRSGKIIRFDLHAVRSQLEKQAKRATRAAKQSRTAPSGPIDPENYLVPTI